jgi:predicted ATPase
LREALARVWKEHGVTAVVGGEAGIGKSRLVGELGAEAMKAGGRVLIGRAYETERILAFGVWVNAFRSGLVAEGVELAIALSPVWRAELARLLPEFGDEPRAAADYRRLFEAVVQLVVLLARDQPLVLVLEDLHWADDMSLRLFSFLCRRIKEMRVLAVGTVRDEELPNAPALSRVLTELGREPHVERIALSPLPRFETDKLVHNLVSARRNAEEVPRLAERVWATSEGNPFIAIEAIRAFLEEEAKGGPRASGLPQRVTDVIAGRLQRLTEPARQITALAAVIGQAFEFVLLARAAELNKNTVAKTLEDLVTRRILNSVGDRFDFSHERIREVAYRQLLRPRRQILHGRVAQALEAMYAGQLERYYTALAIHCREAEAWDKAVAYFRESGRQALSRSAYREATACFEHALGAVAHLPEGPEAAAIAIDLRFDLRNSLQPLGEVQRVLDHLREAERLANRLRGSSPVGLGLWLHLGQPLVDRRSGRRGPGR